MNYLIQALGADIKATGRDKWSARCPVHNDKDFAMSIKQLPDTSVMAHCHACGANGLDLYNNLKLPLDELFGGRENSRPVPREIQETYDMDKLIIKIYEADKAKGIEIGYKDERRYKLALSRKQGIEKKFTNIV